MNSSLLKHLYLPVYIAITLISMYIPAYANTASLQKVLEELEVSSGGRIGMFAFNTANHTTLQYRANERFPMCSTNKVMAVSAILKQSMNDKHLLQQHVTYSKEDLVVYSPITEKHIVEGMTISELCAATIMFSDNTAANLLMKKLGGPAAITAFAHSIGDNTFRLDRWEPELNTANPNDLRDTSTPEAMGKSLHRLAFGNVLAQKAQLWTWLKSNTTGDSRIRAGVPQNWIVGDKTGTGDYGTTNDIGIIWPPKCPPIIVAIYFTQNKKNAAPSDNVIASVMRIVSREFIKSDPCLTLG